jgi:hypothetical protein
MTKTKKRQKNEQYEDYWRITLGNTNYFETNSQAMKVLKLLSDYVDKKEPTLIGSNKGRYRNLQDEVLKVSPKPAKSLESQRESARKEINQFTKLGFFKNGLTEKTLFVDEFINSRSIRKRQKLFSRIVIRNARFNNATTEELDQVNQMYFLLSTLEEVGELNLKKDIKGLMISKIDKIEKGYLTREELDKLNLEAEEIEIEGRKYNQIGYLKNVCRKLITLKVRGDIVRFPEDDDDLFGREEKISPRDKPEYRLHRKNLKNEASGKCMVDRKTKYCNWSHIKPFKICMDNDLEEEALDPDNGFYLNRDIDIYFNNGDISWDDDGNIIFSDNLSIDEKNKFENSSMNKEFLFPERLVYLEFHRKEIFNQK